MGDRSGQPAAQALQRAASRSPVLTLGLLTLWVAGALVAAENAGILFNWPRPAVDTACLLLVVLPIWAVWYTDRLARRRRGDDGPGPELRRRLLNLEGLALHLSDGLIVCEAGDLAGPDHPRILEVNDAQCRMTGYSRKELIGSTPRMLQGPETDRAVLDRIRAALESRQEVREEIVNYGKDGKAYWVELQITPVVDPQTGKLYFVSIQRDVTHRKQLERQLVAAKEQAERSDRAKSMFLATMSHDLRTPLNAVLGFSDLIATELHGPIGNPRYIEYANDIHASGRQLLRLVESILEVSKGDLGQLTVREEDMDLVELCRSQAAAFRPIATRHDIGLYVDLPASLPFRADEVLLGRTVSNLLSNAIRFTDRGGTVRLSLEAGAAPADGGAPDIGIVVTDTGCGIAPEVLANLGTPFYRPATVPAQARDGHGLGLAIVRLIVERHGGRMEIASWPGEGTTVRVVLPGWRRRGDVAVVSDGPAAAAAGNGAGNAPGGASARPHRIAAE